MPLLITADACPSCGGVHGQPTDWPVCPEHGHWLYILRGPLATKDNPGGGGWTYACHAHKCAYTHTQKERATMTATSEAATAALAIRQGQDSWDGKQLAALRQMGVEDAPQGDLDVFFHYCQATALDPFTGQIRLRKDRSKNAQGQWENRWSIETEIDGYRVIAHRAAKRDGVKLSYGPVTWFDRAGGEHKIWLGEEPPAGASMTVYKDSAPFPATIRFKSFAKFTKEGQLQALWAVMPDHLIAKCAEAQALRKAFPHDLEGIGLSDDTPAPQAPAAEIPAPEPAPLRPPRRSTSNREAVRAAIGKEFDRLGLDDAEERGVWVNRISGKPSDAPLRDLTDGDLALALDTLKECADIGELAALCDPTNADV